MRALISIILTVILFNLPPHSLAIYFVSTLVILLNAKDMIALLMPSVMND